MPKPYSNDLRARVIEAIEAGASRREAAERYEISASAAVLWAQRWEETGSFAAKLTGGSTSPLTSTAMVRSRGRCPRGVRLIGHVPQGHWNRSPLWPGCGIARWSLPWCSMEP